MQFRIRRMRHLGRPLDPKKLSDADEVCADIRIQHEGNHIGQGSLGRATVTARIHGSWPLDEPPFPELIDVQLHSMAPNGMSLTGVEVIDGVAYAQSWLCRPL